MAISVLPLPKAMGLPLRDGRPNNDDLLIDMASTVRGAHYFLSSACNLHRSIGHDNWPISCSQAALIRSNDYFKEDEAANACGY